MHELVINLHMHTHYSDGNATHKQIAQKAIQSNLDAIIITDHNVWVNGFEGYYQEGQKRLLLMVGEEVHDQGRQPQKNHLLVLGVGRDLATFANNSRQLIEQVNQSNGLAFIAHPFEDALPSFGEDDISWEDWQISGFTGIELWNAMSEFKSAIHNKSQAIFYALFPQYIAQGPSSRVLQKWDELLIEGKRIVAVGGSDAHASSMSMGPLHRIIFPYDFHFHCINTHLLVPHPLTKDFQDDRSLILDALRLGHAFIGYDLPASTHGFRFSAHTKEGVFGMGDEVSAQVGVTFQIRLPMKTECRLIKNGRIIKTWKDNEFCTYVTSENGCYRVEVFLNYLGKNRGWIFSNPIYVRK